MFGQHAFTDFTTYVSQQTSPSLLALYTVVVGWLGAQTAVLFGSGRWGSRRRAGLPGPGRRPAVPPDQGATGEAAGPADVSKRTTRSG